MSGMKLWPRVVILALFSAPPVMAQTKPLVFYNVDVFDGYHILRGQVLVFRGTAYLACNDDLHRASNLALKHRVRRGTFQVHR
jgi:hypothetical protein